MRLRAAAFLAVAFVAAVALEGLSFYSLPQAERVRHESYDLFRPSGEVGLKLGLVGGALFLLIYLYPIRKRWPWLRKIGNTKRWLDFHILMGLTAPVVITLHSSFKFHGLAGMAFWIMWSVALSGVIGKYLYSRVPRMVSAAEMDVQEIETLRNETAAKLSEQDVFSAAELQELAEIPDAEEINRMSLASALWKMVRVDAARSWRVAGLRRRYLGPAMSVVSLGGLLPLGNRNLENVVRLAGRQSRLTLMIGFLGKTHQLFHLWHVVHRPFSYSLAVLAIVHICFVVAMGYF